MKNTLIIIALLLGMQLSYAQSTESLQKLGIDGQAPQGIAVGEKAPNFSVTDSTQLKFKLSKALKRGPVVLIFFRGYWCPACNRYLAQYADSLGQIVARGATLVLVTPESYPSMMNYDREGIAGFTVLSDTENKIMQQYQVLFNVRSDYQDMLQKYLGKRLDKINASGKGVLPVPATYIIDQKRRIVYRQFDLDYNHRANVSDILANLPAAK